MAANADDSEPTFDEPVLSFNRFEYPADERGVPGHLEKRDGIWYAYKRGHLRNQYCEVARTPEHIILFSPHRGLWVRLTDNEAYWSWTRGNWKSVGRGKPAEGD